MDDFFKGPLQFSGLKTFLLSLRIISSYTVHLSLFINRILKGGHIDPIKSLVGLTSHRHLSKDALWSYERFASHCVTPLCCSRCPFQYLSLRGLDKLRASEPASHVCRASESCESCESSCEPCETEVRKKENPFFGE